MKENKDLALFFIRLALAIVFIGHGFVKLMNLGDTGEAFYALGAPLPELLATIAAIIEFFGGIALLIGMFARISAGLIAIVMATAILEVRFTGGLLGGYQFELTLLLAALAIVFGGAGEATLPNLIKKSRR